jgi:hypothetical protein
MHHAASPTNTTRPVLHRGIRTWCTESNRYSGASCSESRTCRTTGSSIPEKTARSRSTRDPLNCPEMSDVR